MFSSPGIITISIPARTAGSVELAAAHEEGTYAKVIKSYQKIDLLILDEFLLTPLSTNQAGEFLEIMIEGAVSMRERHGLKVSAKEAVEND